MTNAARRFTFIMHGARSDADELRELVAQLRASGLEVTPRVTWEGGDALRFAREAVASGSDTVVVVGGDGTLNEVVNGVAGTPLTLGIVPAGTANDFARQVGIPEDPAEAMEVILRTPPRVIDLATLNERRFINVSTGGLAATASAELSAERKETLGALAYALTGARLITDLHPSRARFSGPGFAFDGEYLLFVVGNTRATGGGSRVTPYARTNDGLLDLCIIEPMPLAAAARLALRVRRGEHVGNEGVHYLQLTSVRVEADEPIAVNVDGEPANDRQLHYTVDRAALRVHLPHLPEEEADGDEAGTDD